MSVEVTITSKNQITLPVQLVRKLSLQKNRVLDLEVSGGKVIMTPKPSFGPAMSQYWSKHKADSPQSDEVIKNAVRKGIAKMVR